MDTRKSSERKRKFDDCYDYVDYETLFKKSRNRRIESKTIAVNFKVSESSVDSIGLVTMPEKAFKKCSLQKTKTFISILKGFESCNIKDNKKNRSLEKTNKLLEGFQSSNEKDNNETTESSINNESIRPEIMFKKSSLEKTKSFICKLKGIETSIDNVKKRKSSKCMAGLHTNNSINNKKHFVKKYIPQRKFVLNSNKILSKYVSSINKRQKNVISKTKTSNSIDDCVVIEKLSKNMYNVPTSSQLKGHDTNPEILKAVMLLWENSGRGKFAKLNNILINDNKGNDEELLAKNIDEIKTELSKETLTTAKMEIILKNFLKKMCNKKKLLTCASCGERSFHSFYKEVSVEDDLEILKLNNSQIEDYENLNEYKHIASVANIQSTLYFIHPECVTKEKNTYTTHVCGCCYSDIRKNLIPKYSIANGHDYGDFRRIKNLQPLTIVEKHLISCNRMYGSILKLKDGENRQLVGNIITFEQNGPDKCAEQFNLPDVVGITEVLQVAFLGTKEEFESRRKDVIMSCGQLQVRSTNIYNWLRMLKRCNPKYWNIEINESDQCIDLMNNITKNLVDKIQIIDNKTLLTIDKVMSNDISKVRELNIDENISYDDKTNENGLHKIPISNTMLFSESLQDNEENLIKKTLHGVAKTIYPKLIKVVRLSDEPINEYENNSKLYLGLFPYLFILGKFGNGIAIKGTMPSKYILHLLNQRYNVMIYL